MHQTNEPEVPNEIGTQKKHSSGRLALVVIALVVCAAVMIPRSQRPVRQQVRGTLTHVDLAARQATVEYIDPASGGTREATGEVPATCKITINGQPASLEDVKIGDDVVARVSIEHHETDGERQLRIVAEEVRVARALVDQP